MKTSSSVATYANANIETMGITEMTPLDLVMAREELIAAMAGNFSRPLLSPISRKTTREVIKSITEVVAGDPVMSTLADELSSFADLRALANAVWQQKQMIFRNFGRFLPDDEKKVINDAKEGLEGIEDRLSAAVYAIDKVKSRKAWKLEQAMLQNASHYAQPVNTKKVLTENGHKWVDAAIHDLPPIVSGKAHAPAYYAMKLPNGTVVNMGASVEGFGAKLNKYPSQAMQNIAARLGIEMRGGDTAILNAILEAEMVEWTNAQGKVEKCYKWLPSYTSAWQGVWIVYVGWRLNPKVTPSRYWLDENQELTQTNPNVGLVEGQEGYEAPLTLSQLDYRLLCESSDLEVQDENGETVEFMNEEEEFLTSFPQRESDETFVDFSKYCEDDEEMELFQACSAVVERSESGLTVGDLESSQFVNEYLHQGINRTEKSLRKMKAMEENAETLAIITNLELHLERLERLDGLWERFVGTHYNEPTPAQATFGAKGDFREPSKVLPCMTMEPLNEVERPILREVDRMPECRHVSYTWSNALSPRLMAKREQEARKGQVFRSIQSNTLSAELAFNATFERALGIR